MFVHLILQTVENYWKTLHLYHLYHCFNRNWKTHLVWQSYLFIILQLIYLVMW